MAFNIDESYWTERYQNQQTGWDLGEISPPLKAYIDQLNDTSLTILIPGSGNSYEAAYLHSRGFTNVFIVDLSSAPLQAFLAKYPDFPKENAIEGDFFELEGQFDLILEQTFFCALPPQFRSQYAEKILSLLKPGGKLVGVLFNIPLNQDRPPFGGDSAEYLKYFDPLFNIEVFEECYNSIKPRQGSELFMVMQKSKS